MRVVSLVPSWTETLIEAGIQVVGRTRYCVHPTEKVKRIAAVGGTKQVDWAKIHRLQPDLVILDKEENPKAFINECHIPWIATHVTTVISAIEGIEILAEKLNSDPLRDLSKDYQAKYQRLFQKDLEKSPSLQGPSHTGSELLHRLPLIEIWQPPLNDTFKVLYVIWKNPYMSLSHNTFIGDILIQSLGAARVWNFNEKYPVVDLKNFHPEETFLLFSTEPFPFAREKKTWMEGSFPCALIDGEAMGWFGRRALDRFFLRMKSTPIDR